MALMFDFVCDILSASKGNTFFHDVATVRLCGAFPFYFHISFISTMSSWSGTNMSAGLTKGRYRKKNPIISLDLLLS
jgi:hypothetical protein